MSKSIQFRVNSYLQLARLCEDISKKDLYIQKAEILLSEYENTAKREDSGSFEDYRVGIIEEYLKGHNQVCLIQVWNEALFSDRIFGAPKMSRKDSNEIANIIVKTLGWERRSTSNFGKYGKQKCYSRPEV